MTASTGLAIADPLVADESQLKALATPAVRRTGAIRAYLKERFDKAQGKVFSEKMTISPELARIMLEFNIDNRKIRPHKLAQLKSDMNAGRFKLNGEPIIFAKTPALNDGQHRLQAIVETNKAHDMMVTFGVERDTRFTVDTGAARSTGDHLTISGWPYASVIASISRSIIGFEKSKGKALGRMSDVSSAEVLQKGTGDKLIQEVASHIGQYSSKYRPYGKPGTLGLVYYQFSLRKPDQASNFFEKLRTGADLSESNPIRILREYLISRPKLTQTAIAELFIRAWNAWLNDKPIKQLRVSNDIPSIES